MTTLLFTIIIPTLNEEKFLPRLLTDLKKQIEKDFEVIVVDGNSEDKTVSMAKVYEKYYSLNIYSVTKRNLSYQRNYGAQRAHCSYLIFLDADSRVNRFFMRDLKKEVTKNKHLILLPTVYPQEGTYTDNVLFNLVNFSIELSQNIGKPIPTAGVMILQKNYFDFLGGYDESGQVTHKTFFPEDHDLILRARQGGVIAKCLKKVRVGFCLRRMQKEGRNGLALKYILSTIQMTFTGKMDSHLFDYEMGGHLYKKMQDKRFSPSKVKNREITDLIERVRTVFSQIVKED